MVQHAEYPPVRKRLVPPELSTYVDAVTAAVMKEAHANE